MLAIHYSPKKEKDILDLTLTLENRLSQTDLLSTFVKDIATKLGLEKKPAAAIRLAMEEAVVNVINYAYPTGQNGLIRIEAKSDGRWLKLIISDEGVPFDPTETLQADTTLSAEDRPVGGLGIHLMRQLMDSINYERVNGKNILTLRKLIKSENTYNA